MISKIEELKNELNIKYTQISKVLIEIVKKINEKRLFKDIENLNGEWIKAHCWSEGSVYRCNYRMWTIVNGELMIASKTDYSGLGVVNYDAIDTIKSLSQHKRYVALHGLAKTLPMFLEKAIKELEKRNVELDETLTKLKTILQILK